MKHNAQTISADALVAIALFMVAVIFFFAISSDDQDEESVKNLQSESSKLVSSLSGSKNTSDSFLVGSKINERKLEELSEMGYGNLKDAFGIGADFCIHFEDEDGNVLNVSGNKTGLGDSLVVVGGVSCG